MSGAEETQLTRYQPYIEWYGTTPQARMQEIERGLYYSKHEVDELVRELRKRIRELEQTRK